MVAQHPMSSTSLPDIQRFAGIINYDSDIAIIDLRAESTTNQSDIQTTPSANQNQR